MRGFVAVVALVLAAVASTQAQTQIARIPFSQMNLPTPYSSSIGDVDGDGVPEAIVVSANQRIITIVGIRGATGTGDRQPTFLSGGFCAEQFQYPADTESPQFATHAWPYKIGPRDFLLVSYFQRDAVVLTIDKVACR